jgi:hypothetical protein
MDCNSRHRAVGSLRSRGPCYQGRQHAARHVALAEVASFQVALREYVEAILGWVPEESGNAEVGCSCVENGASYAWEASDSVRVEVFPHAETVFDLR